MNVNCEEQIVRVILYYEKVKKKIHLVEKKLKMKHIGRKLNALLSNIVYKVLTYSCKTKNMFFIKIYFS